LIIEYISKYGKATRSELYDLLLTKISDVLNEKQKKAKVKNLLFEMAHKDKTIISTGKTKTSEWKIK